MKKANLEMEFAEDGKTVILMVTAEPGYCCAECLTSFLKDRLDMAKPLEDKQEKSPLH